MFAKNSRYRKTLNVIRLDAQGRELSSKDMRVPRVTPGNFIHIINGADRLDHLAHKYYKKANKWWRICDANPQELSPLALLGHESVVTDRFPITLEHDNDPGPWPELRRVMHEMVGVFDVQILEAVCLAPEIHMSGDEPVIVTVSCSSWAVLVTYNRLDIEVEALGDAMSALGISPGLPVRIGRIGKGLIIPPNSAG